jgi:acyl carrier protein
MQTEREKQVVAILAELLKRPQEMINIDASLASHGIDSLLGLRLIGRLSELTGEEIDPMLVIDCSSIRELAMQLDGNGKE